MTTSTIPALFSSAQSANSANSASSIATTAADTDDTALSSDFNTFLQMLTVQMKNQDPLNPVDSSDYAVQLATFSSVEQQVKTNDLLTALGAQFGTMGVSQLASWIGMEARTTAPVDFDGTPISLVPYPATLADKTELVVYDSSGAEVQRSEIARDGSAVDWAGVDSGGNPFANGTYTFELENFSNGESLGKTPVETYSLVTEAQIYEGETYLTLSSGSLILADAISALRKPAS